MKIAVIAADGRSGRAFVKAALAAGHSVRGGALRKSYLEPHSNLTLIPCDATREADLIKLLEGQDAVASFIGHVKGSPPNVQADAIKKLVRVMQKMGLRRVVSLTGTGVRLPGDVVPLIDRLLNMSISIIDPARVRDGKAHAAVLQESELEWTIIRVLKLQNVPPEPFQLCEHGPTKWWVGRDEVAQAALRVLEQRSFVRQMPIICKTPGVADEA